MSSEVCQKFMNNPGGANPTVLTKAKFLFAMTTAGSGTYQMPSNVNSCCYGLPTIPALMPFTYWQAGIAMGEMKTS